MIAVNNPKMLNEWRKMYRALRKSTSKLQAQLAIARKYGVARTTVLYTLQFKQRKARNEYMIRYRGNKVDKGRISHTRHLGLNLRKYNTYYLRVFRHADYFLSKVLSGKKEMGEKRVLAGLWRQTGIEFSGKALEKILGAYEKNKMCSPICKTESGAYCLNTDYYAVNKIKPAKKPEQANVVRAAAQ